MGVFSITTFLLFACVLTSLFVVDTGLTTITSRAAYAVHCATETNRAVALVFFEEAAGAGAKVVSTVIPATTLDNAGLVADERCLAVAIRDTGNSGVTIEIVDDITLLVVTTGLAFRIGNVAHLDAAKAIALSFTFFAKINRFEFVTTIRSNVVGVLTGHWAIDVGNPLAHVTRHIVQPETVREERGDRGSINGIVIEATGNTHVVTCAAFEVRHESTLPAAMTRIAQAVDVIAPGINLFVWQSTLRRADRPYDLAAGSG